VIPCAVAGAPAAAGDRASVAITRSRHQPTHLQTVFGQSFALRALQERFATERKWFGRARLNSFVRAGLTLGVGANRGEELYRPNASDKHAGK